MATVHKSNGSPEVHMVVERQGDFGEDEAVVRKLNPDPEKSILTLKDSLDQMIESLKAMLESKAPNAPSHFFIKVDNQMVNLRLNDVLWIEAYGDYVSFYTDKTRYVVHSTMKAVETRLPADQFARVHRSFIVRQDKIDLIEESLIQIGKKLIPIGESYRPILMSRLSFF